jgi:hypothetical protein
VLVFFEPDEVSILDGGGYAAVPESFFDVEEVFGSGVLESAAIVAEGFEGD